MKIYENTPDAYIIGSIAFIFGGIIFGMLEAGYDIEHHTFNIQLLLINLDYFVVAYLCSCMKKT